ncbi:MAG: ThaI family type II restriction endonuclease [Pseudomonadota bacterium]|nr:ThaI family type II restriction endonuclease [Pseudomonadota bacterium]
MNKNLIDFFRSETRLHRLTSGLPKAFKIVKHEMPKGNPAVGILREHVLTGFFLNAFGEENVSVPDKGIVRDYDIEIYEKKLSIKTVTGNATFKVLWTVDPLQVGREISEYKPFCDILLVEIHWDKNRESIFYIPVEVQRVIKSELGAKYLTARVGTNHRGISLTTEAKLMLIKHKDTISAKVDWRCKEIKIHPHERWVTYWRRL